MLRALSSVALLLTAAVAQPGAQRPAPEVPQQERRVLMELFTATGGERWTKRDGWGSTRPVCEWHGVLCDFVDGDAERPVVAGLWLDSNNLRGALPASLTALSRLQSLNVSRNHLSGEVPQALLQRWDARELEFSGHGNTFSNFASRVAIAHSATGVLCSERDDVRFTLDVDGVSGRTVFQSIRCASAGSRQTRCLVREGTTYSLGAFSRALTRLGFHKFSPKYDQQFTFTTHGLSLTTTVVWGDGTTTVVETYAREGPIDVWIAQQLFLGLMLETSWEREFQKAKCDFESKK
jgi:hypothetical protein